VCRTEPRLPRGLPDGTGVPRPLSLAENSRGPARPPGRPHRDRIGFANSGGVPKPCSERGIIAICRRNRVLTRYRDDAEKLEGDRRIALPCRPQHARISVGTRCCFDEAVEAQSAGRPRANGSWIHGVAGSHVHPTRPNRDRVGADNSVRDLSAELGAWAMLG
jgi:hypothetical protein